MILIAGGTGLIGRALCSLLLAQHQEVTVLTRAVPSEKSKIKGVNYASWNPKRQLIGKIDNDHITTIINLAGANIAEKRWTMKRKLVLLHSRTESTKFLSHLVTTQLPNVKTFIQASAIGFYGKDTHKSPFTESSPPTNDFLGKTCKQWEDSLHLNDEIRQVILRIGLVFSEKGGFFASMKPLLKWNISPKFDNGKQLWSWIHIDDLCQLIFYCIEKKKMLGTYNAVANYTSQINFNKYYLKANKKIAIPLWIPKWVLKIVLGEMSVELLKSTSVSNQKLKDSGFIFKYNDLNLIFK